MIISLAATGPIPMISNATPSKVSVIVPTYNRGWILREALDSILSQDYPDVELIVVDDGSTDDTASILRGYDTALSVIRQPNRGVSAARNAGIGAATGEFIAFLDSDDSWLTGKLTRQVGWFTRHPDMMICQTEEVWMRRGVRVNPKQKHRKRAGMIFKHCLPLCLISPSAVMMRRRLFDAVGLFDETLPACEDYDLWLRVACNYPVGLIDEPLIVKRGGHGDQLSSMAELDKFRITALARILDSGTLNGEDRDAAAQMLRKKCRIYINGCTKRGRHREAADYAALARSYQTISKAAPEPNGRLKRPNGI
jgi:glycosyltransferase involved in cell wall biosynthesis